MDDSTYRWRMRTERQWDEAGHSAREADRQALIYRPPVEVDWEEREARGYWRLHRHGAGPMGSGTQRTGYIPTGSHVPGATPGEAAGCSHKGHKGQKGGKRQGKRSRAEYERPADRHWALRDSDDSGQGHSSSSSQWSWWDSASWAGWWDWNEGWH